MKVEVHHYHHLGAETLAFLQNNSQNLLEINARLKQIQEKLTVMGENQDQLGKTLTEIQEEQKASAARWEVRNTAQQKTIGDLKELVKKLEDQNENSDAELSDELKLAKQILQTEQETFADAQTGVESSTETTTDTATAESGQAESADSAEASA